MWRKWPLLHQKATITRNHWNTENWGYSHNNFTENPDESSGAKKERSQKKNTQSATKANPNKDSQTETPFWHISWIFLVCADCQVYQMLHFHFAVWTFNTSRSQQDNYGRFWTADSTRGMQKWVQQVWGMPWFWPRVQKNERKVLSGLWGGSATLLVLFWPWHRHAYIVSQMPVRHLSASRALYEYHWPQRLPSKSCPPLSPRRIWTEGQKLI